MSSVQSAAVLAAFVATQPDFDASEPELAACRRRIAGKVARLAEPKPLAFEGELSAKLRSQATAVLRHACMMCSACDGATVMWGPLAIASQRDVCRKETEAALRPLRPVAQAVIVCPDTIEHNFLKARCGACGECPAMLERFGIRTPPERRERTPLRLV